MSRFIMKKEKINFGRKLDISNEEAIINTFLQVFSERAIQLRNTDDAKYWAKVRLSKHKNGDKKPTTITYGSIYYNWVDTYNQETNWIK